MPLYNGNVNIIEGGNSLLQLYNYPPAITFVTTGSNRVIFKTKENVFCGGLELQWSKDPNFNSGSTTTYSASIACTSSLVATLLPLANITGAREQFIGYDNLSTPDDGVWYMRLRGENALVLNPTFLPSSSFSDPILVNTNNRFSCDVSGASYIYQQPNIFIADTYNSASNVWQAVTGSATCSVVPGGNAPNQTYPTIERSGSDSGPQVAGLGLNKDTLALNGGELRYYRGATTSGSAPQFGTPFGALFVERGKVEWNMARYNITVVIASGSEGDRIEGANIRQPGGAPGPLVGNFKNKAIYCPAQTYQSGPNQNINVAVNGIVVGFFVIDINSPIYSEFVLKDIDGNARVQLWQVTNEPQSDTINGYNCMFLTDN